MFSTNLLNNLKVVAIVGTTGSGKSALSFQLLSSIDAVSDKDIYIFRFPKPELLKPLGFKVMYSLSEVEKLSNVVLFIDEPQLHLPIYSGRNNEILMKLFSLARQRDITIIISTSDSRYITRSVESYIDTWILKDIEYRSVKAGSMIKHIVRNNCLIDAQGFKLKTNEFVFYNRNAPAVSGVLFFDLPSYFNDEFSKPYALSSDGEEK